MLFEKYIFCTWLPKFQTQYSKKPPRKTLGIYHLWITVPRLWDGQIYSWTLQEECTSDSYPRPRPAASIKRTNEPLVNVSLFLTPGENYGHLFLSQPHRSQSPTSIITPVIQWLLISIYVYTRNDERTFICASMLVLLNSMEALRRA